MKSSGKNNSIERQIDDNLRKIFEEDLEQDLPERLRRLVDELDAPEAADDAADDDGEDCSGPSDCTERTAHHSRPTIAALSR